MAGIVNVPVMRERLGLRAVAYRVRDGGYIDDTTRHVRDTNRIDTLGGRLALRLEPGDGWRVELSGAIQSIDMGDGQYANAVGRALVWLSRLPQPFHQRIMAGALRHLEETGTAGCAWSSRTASSRNIRSSSSMRRHAGTARPRNIGRTATSCSSSHETRLSRSLGNGNSWVGGFTLVSDRDILSARSRLRHRPFAYRRHQRVACRVRVRRGELCRVRRHFLTLGAHATMGRNDGEPSSTPRGGNFTGALDAPDRPDHRLLVAAGAGAGDVRPLRTGYRTGGLAVAAGTGRVADYLSDVIQVGEVGIRKLRTGPTGLAFSLDFSIAHWSNIQADLVTQRGQPYTANIGDARIRQLESSFDWVPIPGLALCARIDILHRQPGPGPDRQRVERDNVGVFRKLRHSPPPPASPTARPTIGTRRVSGITAGAMSSAPCSAPAIFSISAEGRY